MLTKTELQVTLPREGEYMLETIYYNPSHLKSSRQMSKNKRKNDDKWSLNLGNAWDKERKHLKFV